MTCLRMPSKNQYKAPAERFPIRKSELDRFKYGKQKLGEIIAANPNGEALCLDVACGAKPFPEANVLCDLNVKPVPDRSMRRLVTDGKPFVMCSCLALPFRDGAFEFVTSYYLLEHLEEPTRLFLELKRVAKHGYLQCPSWFNELLYGEDVHYWTVSKHSNTLYLRPLSKRRLRFGFIFHRLYRNPTWQVIHAILDETLHLFTVKYTF
jgi:SAM-dependent methyltransferase